MLKGTLCLYGMSQVCHSMLSRPPPFRFITRVAPHCDNTLMIQHVAQKTRSYRAKLSPGIGEKGREKYNFQNIVTGWPLCHTYSVPTGRVLRPRARGPHTCRSCIVHAAATTSGPLGTGQPGMASRLKVAIKCGEASELECHIEGLLRQRGAPGEG